MSLSGREIWARVAGATLAALLLGGAWLTGPAEGVTYEPEPSFCEPTVIRDPLAALARMPKLHQPSKNGQVGFGPPRLRLRTTGGMLVDEGEVGFYLGLKQRNGLSLNWTAKTTLVEVNGNGHPIGDPQSSRKKVGRLKPSYSKRFTLAVPADPAFYRVTILLSGKSGQVLGKFSFYTRVVRPTHTAKLALSASTYHPETTIFMRVENFGNLTAYYGVRYEVEKLEGESWVEAQESPRGPMILIGLASPPGMTGPCSQFRVPPTMAPGMYRISKDVDFLPPVHVSHPRHFVPSPQATLTAEFQVEP